MTSVLMHARLHAVAEGLQLLATVDETRAARADYEMWQTGATAANIKTIYPTLSDSSDPDSIGDHLTAGYYIELQVWDGPDYSTGTYRRARAFYDGWGRTMRTVGPSETSGVILRTVARRLARSAPSVSTLR